LLEVCFEHVSHPGEAQLAQGVVDFDEVYERFPVLWSMRFR